MKAPASSIPVAEAFALIDSNVAAAAAIRVPLERAFGRVLAEPVVAESDHPPLDQSSIDGFAVAANAEIGWLNEEGEWLPGEPPSEAAPAAGEARRVYTGTPLPPGCALVMMEETESRGKRVRINVEPSTELIRGRGGSIRSGDLLLDKGTPIGPGETAVLASVGATRPSVIPAPTVLHLTTGREIVPADGPVQPWQIRDTNGPLIRALLTQTGHSPGAHRHVDESVESLLAAVEQADPFDFLFVSGGSSVGQYDNTAVALESMGFEILFHRIHARPGKPLLFARRGRQWAFGLPGNPVAHFTVFHAFLQRALRSFAGKPPIPPLQARLGAPTPPSTDPRETFWPAALAVINGMLETTPRPWLHSGDLAALRGINALIHFPASTQAPAGQMVSVLPCGGMEGKG